tara:strand:+ start:20648 stop:21238 length:591 start_codon:yes stop_codon:yes gene_type:complete
MISAILLAAGQSKRMHGENKLTKKINGVSLIKHSLQNILNSSIQEIIIVLGNEKEIIEKLIDKNNKIKIVFNNNFKKGMSSSIKTGLKFLSKETHAFFICLGDMPTVNYYDRILSFYNSNLELKKKNKKDIFVPTYKNIQTNPILFNISMKEKIMTLEGDIGAKEILELNKDKILNVNINDLGLAKDFDTPDDFNS